MDASLLMNAVHIAWTNLLRSEQIDSANIETAPVRLLMAVMFAAQNGEKSPENLAAAAVVRWLERPEVEAEAVTLH
jgi:hypothetical protein